LITLFFFSVRISVTRDIINFFVDYHSYNASIVLHAGDLVHIDLHAPEQMLPISSTYPLEHLTRLIKVTKLSEYVTLHITVIGTLEIVYNIPTIQTQQLSGYTLGYCTSHCTMTVFMVCIFHIIFYFIKKKITTNNHFIQGRQCIKKRPTHESICSRLVSPMDNIYEYDFKQENITTLQELTCLSSVSSKVS